jgi:hypothetical protein
MRKLGILVSRLHLAAVTGIARQLARDTREHLRDGRRDAAALEPDSPASASRRRELAFCDHSAQHLGTKPEGLPKQISVGSQFDNATMNHEVDRVIVL